MAFKRGMKKKNHGIDNVGDVVTIMRENVQEITKEFKHFLIIEIGGMVRPSKLTMDERAEPLEGISKFHSIWITSGGKLRGSVLSCSDCTISSRCSSCDFSEVL